jgi:hypothetical protein
MNAFKEGTYAFKNKNGTATVHVLKNVAVAEISMPLAAIGKEVKCGRKKNAGR